MVALLLDLPDACCGVGRDVIVLARPAEDAAQVAEPVIRLGRVAGNRCLTGLRAWPALGDDVDKPANEPWRQAVHDGVTELAPVLQREHLDCLRVVAILLLCSCAELRECEALGMLIDDVGDGASLSLASPSFRDRMQIR